MSKKILVKALDRIIKKGQLQINFADGTSARFGEAVDGLPDVVVRYADNRVPWDIVRDPDLGMTEAVIEGRVIFERSDILGLATVLRVNNRFEETGSPRHLPMWRRVANKIGFELQQMNTALRSKANVAHHYDIGNDLYEPVLKSSCVISIVCA
jgi:cyclopropane-fatty-acyl-phospholipid synthase